jgi:hypothetical protein
MCYRGCLNREYCLTLNDKMKTNLKAKLTKQFFSHAAKSAWYCVPISNKNNISVGIYFYLLRSPGRFILPRAYLNISDNLF